MQANRIKYSNSADWLSGRQGKIGGSTIASIIGLDKYRTPLQVFLDLTGQSSSQPEENKYIIAGHRLEPIVVEYFVDATGVAIDESSVGDISYTHPEYDFLVASPDREYILDGEPCILECKTTQFEVDTDSELFQKWFCQLQWYLMLTGYNQGVIAWLSRGVDFDYREFEANREVQGILLESALNFWNNNVLTNTPPDAVNTSDLMKLYRESTGLSGECDEGLYRTIQMLKDKKERLKQFEEEVEALDEYVRIAIGANEEMTYCGSTVATYRFSTRKTVDSKLLKERYPDVYSCVLKESVTRKLTLKCSGN